MGTFRASLSSDGTMRVHGLDFDNGKKPLIVWKRFADLLVMKAPSRKGWGGQGQPSRTISASFHVFRVTKTFKNGDVEIEMLIDFDARKPAEPAHE